MVSTGSQQDRDEIITAPDRIFISTTYEVNSLLSLFEPHGTSEMAAD